VASATTSASPSPASVSVQSAAATSAALSTPSSLAKSPPRAHGVERERDAMLRAARIARRLIESERDFADDLDTLLHQYWIPLATLKTVDGAQLPRVFGNIEQMALVHADILEKLDRLRQAAVQMLPPAAPTGAAVVGSALTSASTSAASVANMSGVANTPEEEHAIDERLPASLWLTAAATVAIELKRVRDSDSCAIDLYRAYIATSEQRGATLAAIMDAGDAGAVPGLDVLKTFVVAKEVVLWCGEVSPTCACRRRHWHALIDCMRCW
jgi:hypothetical protein